MIGCFHVNPIFQRDRPDGWSMAYLCPLLKLKAIFDPTEFCAFIIKFNCLLEYCNILKCPQKQLRSFCQHQTKGRGHTVQTTRKKVAWDTHRPLWCKTIRFNIEQIIFLSDTHPPKKMDCSFIFILPALKQNKCMHWLVWKWKYGFLM